MKWILTEQKWRVIAVLYQYDELENNHLADLVCISKPSLTGILSRMLDRNLIKKCKIIHDQRVSLIRLSEEGKQYFETQANKMEEIYIDIQMQYGTENIQQLMGLLNDLSKIKP